jgi:hypothetical protein
MRYLRIYAEDDGTSRFEDVELKRKLTHIVDGVPPLLVSGPFACSEIPADRLPRKLERLIAIRNRCMGIFVPGIRHQLSHYLSGFLFASSASCRIKREW